jgi:Polyglycine hydrolase-like, structural repeat
MIVTDWQARHGLTGVDYQTAFDELVGRGYRLVKVAGAGFVSPPDILQAGTITTMTTASAANATYACGWGVDGAGTRQHNGLLPGTLSILQRTAAQREWAAVCNTGNVGSLILGEFLTAIAQVDALV